MNSRFNESTVIAAQLLKVYKEFSIEERDFYSGSVYGEPES